MKITIEGKNIELTKSLKDYVQEKFKKLEKHYDHLIKGHDVRVKLSVERNPRITNNNKTEVIIFLDGKTIHSEEASEDMYASIDIVANKLDRQIEKFKSKHYRSYQHDERPEPNADITGYMLGDITINSQTKKIKKIKSKKFKIYTMTPEEAIDQLDAVDHDFYVFINSKTNQMNTMYQRKNGGYGLIEPLS